MKRDRTLIGVLLTPHPNCRYQQSIEKLSHAELSLTLNTLGIECEITDGQIAGNPCLCFDEGGSSDSRLIESLSRMSSLYMACRMGENGELYPLTGTCEPYLGDDISGILKYKGKTNEIFTRLLINIARLSGDFSDVREPLNVADPICGHGTSLLEALRAGDNAFGVDCDEKALSELKSFLKRYMTYHHLKHSVEQKSLTVLLKPMPLWCLSTSNDAQSYKADDKRSLTLVQCDTQLMDKLVRKPKFHILVADLPYGVLYAPHSQGKLASLETLLSEALPAWMNTMLPGAAMVLSFNTYTLKRDKVREIMHKCGMDVKEGGQYDMFEHWVEQAVNRDIAVCVKH